MDKQWNNAQQKSEIKQNCELISQMGCGTSSESVNTENVSPHPSEYYINRDSAASQTNLVNSLGFNCGQQKIKNIDCKLRIFQSKKIKNRNHIKQFWNDI